MRTHRNSSRGSGVYDNPPRLETPSYNAPATGNGASENGAKETGVEDAGVEETRGRETRGWMDRWETALELSRQRGLGIEGGRAERMDRE